MSEEHLAPAAPESVSPAPLPTEAAETSETPAEAPAPAPEQQAEPSAAPTEPAPEGTLSLADPATPEPAPTEGEKPAAAEEPPAPVEEPAVVEEIKYEFKVPDGFELPAERAEPLIQLLTPYRIPAEEAQKLIDMHFEAMQEARTFERQEQWRVFNEMGVTKRNELMADPELGGAGYETAKAAARRALKMFVPPDRREEFDKRMKAGGMLDDVEFVRAWVNVARRFDEPSPPPPNPAPAPNGAGRPPRAPGTGGSLYRYPRGSRQ